MAQQVFGPAAVVSVLNRAFTNTSPSNAVFNNQLAQAGTTEASQYAFAESFGATFAVGKTAAELSKLVMANMGLDNQPLADALTEYITVHGTNKIGIIAYQLGTLLSPLENDATYGAAAKAWNAEVTASYEYSADPSNTVPSTSDVNGNEAGKNFVLTAGQDVRTGTSGADFFRGVAGTTVGQQDQTTLNSSDILDGGLGQDTLVLLLNGGGYGGVARIKGIETLQLGTNNTGAAAIFDYNVNAGQNEITEVATIVYDQINQGEILTVRNILKTGDVIPTLAWTNEAGSVAGTINADFRASAVTGTATNATVELNNVVANVNVAATGVLNIGAGVETLNLVSGGTSGRNTLNASNRFDGANVDIVSAGSSAAAPTEGGNDDGALKTVVITGTQEVGKAAEVVTAALDASYGLTDRVRGGDLGRSSDAGTLRSTSSNLLSVAATVTEVDASAAEAAVNVRFTARQDLVGVDTTFKGGAGNDYVEFELGNVNADGGAGNDTFAFITNATGTTNSTFHSQDTIKGGEGTDTIQIGLNGEAGTTYTLRTTEFNNKTGIDVLDLRGNTNTVAISSEIVAAADAGKFTIRTDKIVQTSADNTANPTTASALTLARENASTNTIDLNALNQNQGIKFVGGSGSDRIIVNNASLNAATEIDGGTETTASGRYDSVTVVDSAVLDRGDLSNVKNIEVLNLVKNTAAAQFNIDLTEAFLTANTTAGRALQIASVAAANGNALVGTDVVTIDVSDLLNVGNTALKTTGFARQIDVTALPANVVFTGNGGVTVTLATLQGLGLVRTVADATQANVLASVALPTGAAGGGVAPAATNVAVAEGASVIGAAANENFQVTNTANFAAGTTVNGAGGTNSLQLMVATAANAVAIQSAAAVVGAISIANIDTLILADGGNTGPVTINDANARLANITGGTGNDSVTVTAMASGGTINLGVGNDTLTINATLTGAQTLTGGDGVDTLALGAAQNLSVKTISGFETLDITNVNGTVNLTVAQYNGFTGGITANVNDILSFTDGGTVTVNAANSTVQQYVFGAATNFSVLNASNTNTMVTGSAGVDTINYGASAGTTRTIGGDGNDTVTLNAVNGVTDVIVFTTATNGVDTITGFVAANDSVEIDGALQTALDDIGVANAAFVWGVAAGGAGVATAVNITTTAEAINILGAENGGAAIVTAANLTNLTMVAALVNQEITLTAAVGDDALVLIESSTAGTFGVYVYTEAATAGVQATELTLLGVVTGDAVTAADLIMA